MKGQNHRANNPNNSRAENTGKLGNPGNQAESQDHYTGKERALRNAAMTQTRLHKKKGLI